MNLDQALSLLRWALGVGGGYVVGKGYLDQATWTEWSAFAITVAPAVWGLITHTDNNKLAAVEAMPEVTKILVYPKNSSAVEAAADDINRPKVKVGS